MADLPMSRDLAIAQGAKRYIGRPCRKGHIERYVAGDCCAECRLKRNRAWVARNPEKKKASLRQWARENADKKREYHKQYHREWYAKNREAKLAQNAEYNRAHPEVNRRNALKWRIKNVEKARATANKWYRDNPEKRRELGRQKREKKPEVYLVHQNNRRARKLAASGTHTTADLADILRMQNHLCAYCGADLRETKKHLDHVMPLALGGSNDRANLQYLCGPCNMSKGAKDPTAFARERGILS